VSGRTISEKILSAKSGQDARAGDIVVCDIDLAIGTDASSPMAIDYFEQMGGAALFDPRRVLFAMDHYAPPANPKIAQYHERMREFVARLGGELREVGEGISFQRAAELGRVMPGNLVIGADSHTVTLGALGLFATGVGSSDLAAALITGQVWLRVPETIVVRLVGECAPHVQAKDVALEMVRLIGSEGANYQTLELHGDALDAFSLEDRLVLCNLGVEMGAKASIVPFDAITGRWLEGRVEVVVPDEGATGEYRTSSDRKLGIRNPETFQRPWIPASAGMPKENVPRESWSVLRSDPDARFAREVVVDLSTVGPQVSLPHAPDNVVPIGAAAGTPVHMVFIGTCTGGRVSDLHSVVDVLKRGGGRIAPGVRLVVTPASEEVRARLTEDGTLATLTAMGAEVTVAGCGACCGTSGVIPTDGMNVLSTANRNFRARMGNATAPIYLASPATCAASALTGHITHPAEDR
jgi:3-isopropylmalate/(R)-2-methylmalate dehydratase large subunit